MSNYMFDYHGRQLVVRRAEYQYGSCQQPAILCFDNSDWECSEVSGTPYGVLTVNFDDPRCEPAGDDLPLMQFLDVNNWTNIENILKAVDWAEPSGDWMRSGWVEYPIYLFDPNIPHV